ncbi:type II toxin-antitoxin system HipA family toxin [Pseudidiomarina aestuarii]|uniref:Type II toxin-antitoxin system HipA family toxin n=1 Tax=Pseudidiomarina aestuarii TaxID=624146 RepID=A0A6N4DGJ2_9GAMM|nr:type II toxin-antitoxin system HipA family toxin [Pseudidiomarina aestuarii]
MAFNPVPKLNVSRTLSSGAQIHVGVLAQNKQGVFFQYNQDYLARFENLSPFHLNFDGTVQPAPKLPHAGLHGVFADALPDGWGLLLQNRVFRKHGILPINITAMDRLAFVGQSALGALAFSPTSDYVEMKDETIQLDTLGLHAQALFDGETDEVLSELVASGSSGGARPKAQVYFTGDNYTQCRTQPQAHDHAWLVKFTSANLALGHEEGLCEAAYLTMALAAGLNPPEWQLLNAPERSGAEYWLALKRFDYLHNPDGTSGRLHLHSACGLLDADFRTPSMDYMDLIKATKILCKSPAMGQLQFKRAVFNLLVCNQDDHSKNWAFLQSDSGAWQPAPFYDVTFSPSPYGEHATSFAGFGKRPPLAALQQLADTAGFARWSQARLAIEELVEVVSDFTRIAKSIGIHPETTALITKQLDASRQHVLEVLR